MPDMPGNVILGACNPKMAFEALKLEPRAAPCCPALVIVRERENGTVEVSAIAPVASMQAIDSDELHAEAGKVQVMLSDVIKAR